MTLPFGRQRHVHDLGDGVQVIHVERWMDAHAATLAFQELRDTISWRQDGMKENT